MNRYDAFSHSAQCDEFFSLPSNVIGGVPHVKCLCWCHRAETLYATPEPEYDLTPPPEYLSSADRAFIDLPPVTSIEVGFNIANQAEYSVPQLAGPQVEFAIRNHSDSGGTEIYGRRSAHELATGKCDTCGDVLKDCECVE